MRWAGHIACTEEMRNANIFIASPDGKRPSGKPRCRLEDNFTMNLSVRWEGVDWIHLAECRVQWWDLVNTVMNLQVP
jgi:hypothetical protein